MDSKPTAEQREQLHKIMETAGEVLFEASGAGGSVDATPLLKALAGVLGQLYGEAIRACGGNVGLKHEVQMTFMSGMAISPNFGREEVLRDSGAEAQEEKTPGQLLYEEHHSPKPGLCPWARLPDEHRLAYEARAADRSEPGVIRITEEEMHDPRQKEMEEKWYPMARKMGEAAHQQVRDIKRQCDAKAKPDMLRQITAANRTQEIAAKKCDKCQDTGDMGFTMFVKCDGC